MVERERLELETQREYAIRQHAWFGVMATIRATEGNHDAADSYATQMLECNGTIDTLSRKLRGL
jgi:hypothetical protein